MEIDNCKLCRELRPLSQDDVCEACAPLAAALKRRGLKVSKADLLQLKENEARWQARARISALDERALGMLAGLVSEALLSAVRQEMEQTREERIATEAAHRPSLQQWWL